MNQRDLVSIIIPTKNRVGLLRETLDSIRSQTHENWEAIVVDDGSTDDTWDYLQTAARSESRIHPVLRTTRSSTGGAQVCRNVGLSFARGGLVLFLDSDDLLEPACLEQRVAMLLSRPDLSFVVGQCRLFNRSPGDCAELWAEWPAGQDDLDAFLGLGRIPWQTSGPLWRRSFLDVVGPWDETLLHAGHDHEFHVRALCRGAVHVKIDSVDYHWRRPRTDSLSSHEAFQRRHANGDMILAFQKIVSVVAATGRLTASRRRALRREAVRLASLCRLNRGTRAAASAALGDVAGGVLFSRWERLEIGLALRLWPLRIGARIPAMAYLNRRHGCTA